MRFATLSTLTVATALSMPPTRRRQSPRLRAEPVARGGGSSTNSGGGVAFAASAMLLVSAHRTVFSVAMPELQASARASFKVGALQAAYLAGYGLTNAAALLRIEWAALMSSLFV